MPWQTPRKPRFVEFAGVRTLLDLKHLDLLKHLKTMAEVSKQYHIAGTDHTTLKVLFFIVIEVNPHLSSLDEEHFERVLDRPLDRIVAMRNDFLPRRVIHVRQLLGKAVWREKRDSVRLKIIAHNNCHHGVIMRNLLDHFCTP